MEKHRIDSRSYLYGVVTGGILFLIPILMVPSFRAQFLGPEFSDGFHVESHVPDRTFEDVLEAEEAAEMSSDDMYERGDGHCGPRDADDDGDGKPNEVDPNCTTFEDEEEQESPETTADCGPSDEDDDGDGMPNEVDPDCGSVEEPSGNNRGFDGAGPESFEQMSPEDEMMEEYADEYMEETEESEEY